MFLSFWQPWTKSIERLREVFPKEGDIVTMAGFPFKVFGFRHPDHIQQILAYNQATRTNKPSFLLPRVRHVMGSGSFIARGGPAWKKHREAVQSSFAPKQSNRLADSAPMIVSDCVERWVGKFADGKPVDPGFVFGCFVTDLFFKLLFHHDLGAKVEEVYETTHRLVSGFISRFPLWIPFPENAGYYRDTGALRKVFVELIAARREEKREADDVVTALIARKDQGQSWSDEEICDELLSIYFGASTVRIVLVLLFFCICEHPEALQKCEAEIAEVLGERPPVHDDLPRMKWPLMIFQEMTRLYPPVWGLPQLAAEPVEIGGRRFPKGSILLTLAYYAGRHPDFWPDAESFRPNRFDPEQSSKIHPFAHYPFGGGPRMCLGRHIAPVVCQMILIRICQRYRFSFQPAISGITFNFDFELLPQQTLSVKFSPK